MGLHVLTRCCDKFKNKGNTIYDPENVEINNLHMRNQPVMN